MKISVEEILYKEFIEKYSLPEFIADKLLDEFNNSKFIFKGEVSFKELVFNWLNNYIDELRRELNKSFENVWIMVDGINLNNIKYYHDIVSEGRTIDRIVKKRILDEIRIGKSLLMNRFNVVNKIREYLISKGVCCEIKRYNALKDCFEDLTNDSINFESMIHKKFTYINEERFLKDTYFPIFEEKYAPILPQYLPKNLRFKDIFLIKRGFYCLDDFYLYLPQYDIYFK